jgi:hypothetical protein
MGAIWADTWRILLSFGILSGLVAGWYWLQKSLGSF